jgi:hypothetical protein
LSVANKGNIEKLMGKNQARKLTTLVANENTARKEQTTRQRDGYLNMVEV